MSNSRLFNPLITALDSNGRPISGAKLWFFQSGTTTPQATYSDVGLTTANANPVVADSAGRFNDIYLNFATKYKAVLTTAAATNAGEGVIKTFDPISPPSRLVATDFGAAGDGVTDDTAAIKAILDLADQLDYAIIDGNNRTYLVNPAIFTGYAGNGFKIPSNTIFQHFTIDCIAYGSPFAHIFYFEQGGQDMFFQKNRVLGNGNATNGVGGANSTLRLLTNAHIIDNYFEDIQLQKARAGFVGGGKAATFQAGCKGCTIERNYFYNCYFGATIEGNYNSSFTTLNPPARIQWASKIINNTFEECTTPIWLIGLDYTPDGTIDEAMETNCIVDGNSFFNCGLSNNSRVYTALSNGTGNYPPRNTGVVGSVTYTGQWQDDTTSSTDFSLFTEYNPATAYTTGQTCKVTDDGSNSCIIALLNAKQVVIGNNTLINTESYGTIGCVIRGVAHYITKGGVFSVSAKLKHGFFRKDEIMALQPAWYILDTAGALNVDSQITLPDFDLFGGELASGNSLYSSVLPETGQGQRATNLGHIRLNQDDILGGSFLDSTAAANPNDYHTFITIEDSKRGGLFWRMHPGEMWTAGLTNFSTMNGTATTEAKITMPKVRFVTVGNANTAINAQYVIQLRTTGDRGGQVGLYSRDGLFQTDATIKPQGNGDWDEPHFRLGDSDIFRDSNNLRFKPQSSANITGITQANPAVVTISGTAPVAGTKVRFASVGGMTQVNGLTYVVANPSGSTFELSGTNSTGFGAYTSGGSITIIGEPISASDGSLLTRVEGTGTAAPTSTPTAVGNFFVDTTAKKLYVATGTSSSADWTILN